MNYEKVDNNPKRWWAKYPIDTLLALLCMALAIPLVLRHGKALSPPAEWSKILNVSIVSRSESGRTLMEEVSNKKSAFILITELSACPSCITKGIAEIRELQKKGRKGIIVVSHQWIDEWFSWSRNYEGDPLYFVNKDDLNSSVVFPYFPILLEFAKGKLISYKYITF